MKNSDATKGRNKAKSDDRKIEKLGSIQYPPLQDIRQWEQLHCNSCKQGSQEFAKMFGYDCPLNCNLCKEDYTCEIPPDCIQNKTNECKSLCLIRKSLIAPIEQIVGDINYVLERCDTYGWVIWLEYDQKTRTIKISKHHNEICSILTSDGKFLEPIGQRTIVLKENIFPGDDILPGGKIMKEVYYPKDHQQANSNNSDKKSNHI